jgi:hypothetical protein
MLRKLALLMTLCVAPSLPAMADCLGDCAAQYGICIASWVAWDEVCLYYAEVNHDEATDYCQNFCSYPCDPWLCQNVADIQYREDSIECENRTRWGESNCEQSAESCIALCTA